MSREKKEAIISAVVHVGQIRREVYMLAGLGQELSQIDEILADLNLGAESRRTTVEAVNQAISIRATLKERCD